MIIIGNVVKTEYEFTVDTGATDMPSDYRVIFEPFEEGSEIGEYTIREVYYTEDGEIKWWDDNAVELSSDDFWEFADRFDAIAAAFDKPILILIDDELHEIEGSEDESIEDSEDDE